MTPQKWMDRIRDWTLRQKDSPSAALALFLIAVAESSFFPIPPDVLLIAILALSALRWRYFAFLTLLGSLLGGIFGYLIGWGFYQAVGEKIVEIYHLEGAVKAIGGKYADNAFLTVFIAAFTPVPYKVITISAGLFKIDFLTFMLASLIGRGGRFFAVAYVMRLFGPKIEKVLEKYFNLATLIFVVLLIGGFLLLKYVF